MIGFCLGGGFAVTLAPGHGYSASGVNYGNVPKDAESLLAGACPIVGSYGAKDVFLNNHRDAMFRMIRIAGIGYHEPSARDARQRIVSFFDAHLKS